MDSPTAQWFVHSLQANQFARSGTLARVVQACRPDPQDLRRLLSKEGPERETVWSAKHDRTARPGSHLSPRSLWEWAELMEDVEERYWDHASPHDHRVFGQVLLPYEDPRRRSHSQVSDPTGYKRLLAAVQPFSESNGAWIGRLDVKDFYRRISARHVLDLLGPKGMGLHWRLVDRISTLVEAHEGLPQGLQTSHCVARLLLTTFDRQAADMALPCLRQSDDIWVFGHSREDVFAKMVLAWRILRRMGFECNRSKWSIEPPERIEWIRHGIFWGDVRIEGYGTLPRRVEVGSMDPDPSDSASHALVLGDEIEWTRLYRDEFAPGKPCRSDHGNRETLRKVGKEDPGSLVRDARPLVAERAFCIPYLLSDVEDDLDRRRIVGDAFVGCQRDPSREDSRMQAVQRVYESDAGFKAEALSKLARTGSSSRAVRNFLFDQMPAQDVSLDQASDVFSEDCWLDEQAAFLGLLKATPTAASRIAKQLSLKSGMVNGMLSEMVDQASLS